MLISWIGSIEVVAWQKKLISLIIWTIAVKCWNGMRLNLIFGLMLDSHLVLIAAYSFTNCSTIVPPITPPPGLLTIIIYEFAFQLQPRNPSSSSSGKSPSVAGSSLGHMCQCGSALWPRRNWTFTILSLMVIRQICWASTCGQVWTIPPKHESKWNLVTLCPWIEGIPESILLGMDDARRYVCTFSITAAIWSVCVV